MQTHEGFQRFSDLLLHPPLEAVQAGTQPDDEPASELEAPVEMQALLREVRLFHAALRERLNAALSQLMEDIAATVLARELQIAESDLTAVIDRAMRAVAEEKPLCVRAHPDDAAALCAAYPAVADASLRRGDVVIEVHDGTIDASLGARFAALMESIAP